MNKETVPFEALVDVVPGEPWQPEPAARYNALNELLRQGSSGENTYGGWNILSDTSVNLVNVSDKTIKIYSPVEILPYDRHYPYYLDFRNLQIYGQPVQNLDCIWGVAMENIAPKHAGPVQIAGVAFLYGVKGTPERFIDVVPQVDGSVQYEYAKSGRAELLFIDDNERAAVLLGPRGSNVYNGLFAVIDNGDRSFTIKGGWTDVRDERGYWIDDTVFTPSSSGGGRICLAADWGDSNYWTFSYVSDLNIESHYIPGRRIFWELARYDGFSDKTGKALNLRQTWQGGMINFKDRWYLS